MSAKILKGLTSKEASTLLKQYGPNTIESNDKVNPLSILFSQFRSPLIFILMIAAGLSASLHELRDAVFIILVVMINVSLGFFQEYRAERTLEKLKESVSTSVKVLRDGIIKLINTAELVPGDIVLIEPGSRIAADGEVIESSELEIEEALITGESLPVVKKISDTVFMGTIIASGLGKFKVKLTGSNTEYGKIAKGISKGANIKTPTQKRLISLSKLITIIVLLITLLIIGIGLLQGINSEEIVLTAIALGVSTIPEGLMIAYTIVLALGMNRIMRKKAIVKNLPAAETLGGIDVLCIDKTGTITKGEMSIKDIETNDLESALITLTASNNEANFVDEAIKKFVLSKTGIDYWTATRNKIKQIFPFNSKEKYTASFDGERIYLIGSPEKVFELSNNVDESHRSKIQEQAVQGRRIVAFASKAISKSEVSREDIVNMTFEGLIYLEDPIRETAREGLLRIENAGIQIKIITGDLKETALRILQNLDIHLTDDEIISGEELKSIQNELLLDQRILSAKLFYRTTPEQKLIIVNSLQKSGKTVGMMGDGVNDAPALRNAEIGIGVDKATDVSKEASDIVLLDTDFQTIVGAVDEGRNILLNLKKIFANLLTASYSETILILISLLMKLPIPLLPLQLLWINLIVDGLPSIALAFDRSTKDLLTKEYKTKDNNVLDPILLSTILFTSIIIDLIYFGLYFYMINIAGEDVSLARTIVFAGIATSSLLFLFSAKTINTNIWKENIFNNKILNLSVIIGFALMLVGIYYTPISEGLFQLVPLSLTNLLIVLIVSSIDILLIEILKIILRKIHN